MPTEDKDSPLQSIAAWEQFSCVVGKVIKSCGMVEVHVNHFIRSLGKDPILVKHALKLPLNRRIQVLRDLILNEPELKDSEVRSQLVCNDLEKIAKERNIIAHNPVVVAAPPTNPRIINLRSDSPNPKEYTEADLEAFHQRIWEAITTLLKNKVKSLWA